MPELVPGLRAVLEFYGDESGYPDGDGSIGPLRVIQDRGRIARAALASLSEAEEWWLDRYGRLFDYKRDDGCKRVLVLPAPEAGKERGSK